LSLVALGFQAVPQFWLGMLMIFVSAVLFKWLPSGGTQSLEGNLSGFTYVWDRLVHMILPQSVFTVGQIATYLRFTRSAMLETLKADFVGTAKAKGSSPFQLVGGHALRNALLPLITFLALGLSGEFSGANIAEQVFSYQGVGKLVYDSIIANDYNVALISFSITVGMVVMMNTLADICYAWADPRVKIGGASK
jgi:peptide/nickel transport system permease protein